jgi:hypothetical protein
MGQSGGGAPVVERWCDRHGELRFDWKVLWDLHTRRDGGRSELVAVTVRGGKIVGWCGLLSMGKKVDDGARTRSSRLRIGTRDADGVGKAWPGQRWVGRCVSDVSEIALVGCGLFGMML